MALFLPAFLVPAFLVPAFLTGAFLTGAFLVTDFFTPAPRATLPTFATFVVLLTVDFVAAKALLLSTAMGSAMAPMRATLRERASHFLLTRMGVAFFWNTSIWYLTFHSYRQQWTARILGFCSTGTWRVRSPTLLCA